jgi:hypothetical protein
MSKNQTTVKKICEPFCAYYKPGKNEDLLCRGAVVFHQLQEAGRELSLPEPRVQPSAETVEGMVKRMCSKCDFYERDCDFMDDRSARPCGGFVVLSLLVQSGQIELDDVG